MINPVLFQYYYYSLPYIVFFVFVQQSKLELRTFCIHIFLHCLLATDSLNRVIPANNRKNNNQRFAFGPPILQLCTKFAQVQTEAKLGWVTGCKSIRPSEQHWVSISVAIAMFEIQIHLINCFINMIACLDQISLTKSIA